VLKVTLPRPSSDAVLRDGSAAIAQAFDDSELPVVALTRGEAEALRRSQPTLSPWLVVVSQVVVGVVSAAFVAWLVPRGEAVMSALYGAAVVAVPGALMARGATGPLSALSPLSSSVSMMGWGFVKTALSVVMLVLASRIVPALNWPVMLATIVVCMQTYWFALLWRGRAR